VGDALRYAHGPGFVRRGGKPANILLDANDIPELTDFDPMKADDITGGTAPGGGLGTWLYAAPEALRARQSRVRGGDRTPWIAARRRPAREPVGPSTARCRGARLSTTVHSW
jgi:serine/threonine protein kinase